MKTSVIKLLVLFSFSCSIIYGQTVLLDFDDVNYSSWDGWNATITTVSNPVSDEVNSSALVGHYYSDEFITDYNIWGLAWFDLPDGENIVFGSSKSLSLKVLAPAAGASMIIKLEDKQGGTNAPNIEVSASGYSPGSWEKLIYNFSSAYNGVYDRIAFYSSTHDTWDIDDLIIENESTDPRIIISDDGEIKEGMENGEIIYVLLENDVFVETIDQDNWLMNKLPAGVSKGLVTRIDSVHVQIALSGNATASYGGNNITDVAVAVKAEDLVNSGSGLTAMTGVTFYANTTGINSNYWHNKTIYPNPVSQTITIEGEELSNMQIYNINGELMFSREIYSEITKIDFSEHPEGIYIMKLIKNNGDIIIHKLVKDQY